MDTNQVTALRTIPPGIFNLHELIQPRFFYSIKIFDHAHGVFRAISFIEALQLIAGEGRAFKTKLCRDLSGNFAVLYLTARAGVRFAGGASPAAGAIIIFSQISHANAAVHPAGRD